VRARGTRLRPLAFRANRRNAASRRRPASGKNAAMGNGAKRGLSNEDLQAILGVTTALAAPFDLGTMLAEVVNAAKQVLHADRGSVWLHDARTDELVLEVATGIAPLRVPAGAGIVGACASTRRIINVPDCYADPRFDATVDRNTGYRTRCMLTLPLVEHKDALVGVMQVLNKDGGSFDAGDEALAGALAAQCAVALQRARMTEALIEGERMRQSLELARSVQLGTLPRSMPAVRGYDLASAFRPAEMTGGDTFDLSPTSQGLLVLLGDATGHGIAPALSVTQLQAMLRIAFLLEADLDTAFRQVNDELARTLPDDRFITAFVSLLDPETHTLRFQSGGQGPVFHFKAASGEFVRYGPTSFPLGAMPLVRMKPAVEIAFAPGDILVLLSDGVYECEGPDGALLGEAGVQAVVAGHRDKPAAELMAALLAAVDGFAAGTPQADDITAVLVKRDAHAGGAAASATFARRIESLPEIFAFTERAFERAALDPQILPTVDFTLEELFTNMVKYSTESTAEVRIDLVPVEGGVEATLTDYDVEPFDVTLAPDADVSLPAEQRRPGGLGLHLVRRLVDSMHYAYSPERRESRITFRKTSPADGETGGKGGNDADD
jgi:sigma-B regulation protein RsbU (phosphoserine phosphatase)